ncbi:MAG: hypothetical protein PHQ62_04070 [Clostridia bacterium]|nr:hypothetical protein [Clostridia bacterium]
MDNFEIPIRNLDLVVNKEGEYVLIFWNKDRTAFKEILTDEVHEVKVEDIYCNSGFMPKEKTTKDFFVPNYCIEQKCSCTDLLENVNSNLFGDIGVFMSVGYEHKLAEKLTEKEIKSFKDSADKFIENNQYGIEEFENYKVKNGWALVGGFNQFKNASNSYYFNILGNNRTYDVIMDQFMQKAKTIAKELNNGEFDADFIINGATDLETLKSIAQKGLGKYAYLKKEKELEVSQNEEKLEETISPPKIHVKEYRSLDF